MQEIVQRCLDEVLLFQLDVRLFYGNRKAKPDDLDNALQVKVEEDPVFSLGVKRVFDKDQVLRLQRVKAEMERVLDTHGAPFLKGWAIPDAKAEDVAKQLHELSEKGNLEKTDILKNFDSICRDYAAANPKWANVINSSGFTEAYVRDRVHFGFKVIRVAAGRDSGPIYDTLNSEVGGLLGELLASVAKAANRFITDSLTGREKVTRKALRPLAAAREKMAGFTFLDQRVRPLCEVIDQVIGSMPDDGPIDGIHLMNLVGMATILTNSKMALDVGEKACTTDKEALFAELFQIQQTAPNPPAQPLAAAVIAQAVAAPVTTTPVAPMPPMHSVAGMAGLAAAPAQGVDLGNLFAA